MTDRSDVEMVAYALEMDQDLLPFAPELLADLSVLGADVTLIVDALRQLGISERSTVVDLGCGKGGTAIAIAGEFGCRVVGVELFEPFVDIAQTAAENAGLSELCHFVHGNIRDLAGSMPAADAVIYAALGDVLGPLDATIEAIRDYVGAGGHIVVNDSCLRDGGAPNFPGFENYAELDETRRRLTACGDELVLELFETPQNDTDDDADDELALIAGRAAELSTRHPHLASAFNDFVSSQQNEYDYLERDTIGAVWAVRRR